MSNIIILDKEDELIQIIDPPVVASWKELLH